MSSIIQHVIPFAVWLISVGITVPAVALWLKDLRNETRTP